MDYSVAIDGWPLGVDNIQPDHAVDATALRAGVNVDVYDGGKLRMRRGFVSMLSANIHSLWSDPHDPSPSTMYYSTGGIIKSTNIALTATSIVSGLSPVAHVAFCQVDGDVFWSNNAVSGRIVNGVNVPWGLETPANHPVLTATIGSLEAGTYQVTVTFRNAAGEESAAQNSVSITLAATGGIALTAIPVALDSTITQKNIYLTAQNGDVLYRAVTLAANVTTYTFNTVPARTIALRTQDMAKMPAGSIIAHRNGQMYVASGKFVYFSEPMRYGQYNPTKNFYAFSSDVSVMLATPDGLYVCADKSYFISKPGTDDATQEVLLPFGAASGTGVYLPNKTDVAWFSARGQVVASGGKAEIVTEKHFAPSIMTAGASFVRELEGLRQIVNVSQQSATNSLAYTGA